MVDSWTDKVLSLTVLIAAGLSLKGVVSAGLTVIIPAGSSFAGCRSTIMQYLLRGERLCLSWNLKGCFSSVPIKS